MRDPRTVESPGRTVGWQRPLLPNEPRIAHPALEQRLTDTHLQPALTELEALLWEVRLRLDPELQARQPTKLGKPYPLGQCLEIAEAVQARLRTLKGHEVTQTAARGLAALRRFQQAGGSVRQVWGDLRGQYFQNAFQVGTLYIDVANDTVNPIKPKIEILPWGQANFHPIRDWHHFVRVARSYWGGEYYPNHLLPNLAPYCPVLWETPYGTVMVHDATQYMLALNQRDRFEGSRSFLAQSCMPAHLFNRLREALKAAPSKDPLWDTLASRPEQGRQEVLSRCHAYRKQHRHWNVARSNALAVQVQALNRWLASFTTPGDQATAAPPMDASAVSSIQSTAQPSPMNPASHLNIDGRTIDIQQLSAEARAQLEMLQFCDQRLTELKRETAITQTARNAYAAALRGLLPPESSESPESQNA